jgi:hypothetical protein
MLHKINKNLLSRIKSGDFKEETLRFEHGPGFVDVEPYVHERADGAESCLDDKYIEARYLDDEDVVVLAEALKENPAIKKLDLGCNTIGDEGIKALSEVSHLEALDLKGNNITDDGAVLLTRMIQLRTLLVRDNPISEKGIEILSESSIPEVEVSCPKYYDKVFCLSFDGHGRRVKIEKDYMHDDYISFLKPPV